jgi:hypothetical protein
MTALTLEQRAKVRATALPLPEAVPTGETRTFGRPKQRRTLPQVTIGDWAFYVGPQSGRVYETCWKCPENSGTIPHYMGIYEGVCFACNGAGVRLFAETVEAAAKKVRSGQARAIREAAKWELETPAREAAEKAAAEAALLAAWEAALREDARRTAEAEAFAAQRFLGAVGEKVTVTGKVTANLSIEGRFGYRTTYSRLVIIEGVDVDAGVTLKTFGTSAWHYDVEVGDVVEVTATVKDHEVYRGVKQTAVARPKGKILTSTP